MGHYDSCYAADDVCEALKKIDTSDKINFLLSFNNPITYYLDEASRSRILITAINQDPLLSQYVEVKESGYKVYIAERIKNFGQVEAAAYLLSL